MGWRRGLTRCVTACVVAWSAAGCGGGGGGGDGAIGASQPSESYFPMSVGDRWIVGAQTVRVTGTRTVGGELVTVLEQSDGSGTRVADYLYVRDRDGVRQVPAEDADELSRAIGPVQVLRFPLVQGDSFTQVDRSFAIADLDGDGRDETLQVTSVVSVHCFQRVVVPAGSFDDCARVRTILTQTLVLSSNAARETAVLETDEWFAPGVGSVKAVLTSYYAGQTGTSSQALDGYGVGGRRSETVAPSPIELSPTSGGRGNAVTPVSVRFSEAIDLRTQDSANFTVRDALGTPMRGVAVLQPVAAQQASQAVFTAVTAWPSGTYTARLEPSITDRVGNPLSQAIEWSFTIDGDAPAVRTVTPADGATEVAVGATVRLVFSEPIDPTSLSTGRVALRESGGADLAVTLQLDGDTVTLTPAQALAAARAYDVEVSGLRDLEGNTMSVAFTAGFRTTAGRFAYPQALLDHSSPVHAVAVGDVNGDGRPDVLMATGFSFDADNDFKLFVRHGLADGTLAPPLRYDTGNAYPGSGSSLSVVDVDGDGHSDVVMGQGDAGIEVFLQQPDGTLASAYRLGGGSYRARTADLDGDGRVDIVSLAFGSNTVQIWRQQPGGGFIAPTTYPVEHGGWESLDVGDVNGDGRADIVITSGQGSGDKALAVMRQQVDGSHGPVEYRATGSSWGARGVAIGDVSGDGRHDIVVSAGGNSPTFIGVLRQAADGSLAPLQALDSYDIPSAIGIADMDGDGRRDVIVAHDGWLAVSFYAQAADGSLGAAQRFPAQ